MARKLRVQYPGAIYHVMNRGDRRESIYEDDEDRSLFLETLGEACQKTDWEVHAWCLMGNHFHLVIETPRVNLVSGMQWVLGVYTNRFNRRHKEFGHLFSGRYKALVVDGSGNGYLKSVCDYVHLNPVRANLVLPGRPLQDYCWSSYPYYLAQPEQRPPWLRVDRLFGEWGIPKDSVAGREQFASHMEARRNERDAEFESVRSDWCLGSEQFRRELLAQVNELASPRHAGPEIEQAVAAKAERILQEELKRLGWGALELGGHSKGHPQKVRIAARLRQETTMTLKWVADRLQMGAPTHLAHLLYWHERNTPNQSSADTLF
jgi:putative transposase